MSNNFKGCGEKQRYLKQMRKKDPHIGSSGSSSVCLRHPAAFSAVSAPSALAIVPVYSHPRRGPPRRLFSAMRDQYTLEDPAEVIQLHNAWEQTLGRLATEVPPAWMERFIKPLAPVDLNDGVATIATPGR